METQGAQGKARMEEIARAVFFAGLEVHRTLGPGMLESTYKQCMVHQLEQDGFSCRVEVALPIEYKGLFVADAYRIDILVADCFPIELKAVEAIHPRHRAQLLTYLKHGGFKLGFLINFNEKLFKDGVTRIANGL